MKKNLFLAPLCLILIFSFADGGKPKSVVGRWKVHYGNDITGVMVCRADGHFEATFTGQTWKVGGEYKIDGNSIAFSDSTCGFGYWGKYKLNWYSDDSLKAAVVEDSCSGRKMNGDGAVLVRMKK